MQEIQPKLNLRLLSIYITKIITAETTAPIKLSTEITFSFGKNSGKKINRIVLGTITQGMLKQISNKLRLVSKNRHRFFHCTM